MIKKSLLEYSTRGLDFCQFCGKKYNVGERIPRIMVHCGHTFCTDCLSKLHKKNRVRCPLCTKLIKNVESVEKLPLNMNILYEVIEKDKILSEIEFDFNDEDEMTDKLCEKHDDRIKHFYCSNHLTIFCRECIRDDHTDPECFVVDLYEIQKMRDLQKQNVEKNSEQIEKMNLAAEKAN
eukprot:CAMPEP_0168337990 /NCGR_PEP_ID=MMETSP0213-20121227/12540_1 /TAXON_ID=151035 /ORGANISM="Euplotes harpa, Strain FSP1.4" /LENGTH=178 /DNA_ID=CAMNT_0008343627 /DNA_START=18 /DNA_END=554 /DNA_ORIENTATION=-